MKEATDLMVSGCSAGGLATFLHADQWCDRWEPLWIDDGVHWKIVRIYCPDLKQAKICRNLGEWQLMDVFSKDVA